MFGLDHSADFSHQGPNLLHHCLSHTLQFKACTDSCLRMISLSDDHQPADAPRHWPGQIFGFKKQKSCDGQGSLKKCEKLQWMGHWLRPRLPNMQNSYSGLGAKIS